MPRAVQPWCDDGPKRPVQGFQLSTALQEDTRGTFRSLITIFSQPHSPSIHRPCPLFVSSLLPTHAPPTTMASTSSVWSVWIVLSLTLTLASASPADGQGGGGAHCPPVLCGGVKIAFPFGVVQEQATATNCGGIGFQVRCVNGTPYLGYSRYDHWLQILSVSYTNASLLVADTHKLETLGDSDVGGGGGGSAVCRIPGNNSSTKVALPFSISPLNQDLILYNCTKAPAPDEEGLVEMTRCGNRTFARIGGRYGEPDDDGGYSLDGCGATVVPVLVKDDGKANASDYEQLISGGFLLTWQWQTSKLHLCTEYLLLKKKLPDVT